MNRVLAGFQALLLVSSLASVLDGQTTSSEILGLVTDSTGAAVARAKVTVTNRRTGVTQTVETNSTGNYDFPLVPVGDYELKCEASGFKTEVATNIRVETAAHVRRDFALEVGAVTETVEVVASAVTLNTENAVEGGVIENKRIIELPLNGRNVVSLAVLVPGVQFGLRTGLADGLGGFPIPGSGFSVSANGQREIHQVVSLDGTDAKDPRIHITNFVPSIEAIEEFKIETNSYSAETGFGGGAVVNMTMKSGTNDIHGTLFEFLRNDKFDAEDYFLNFQPAPGVPRKRKNSLRRNQYGLVVSGPLRKNKTFWAFDWEARKERIGTVQESYFALPEFRNGDFSQLLHGTINPATGKLYRPPIVIYDPYTGQPFDNNIIPKSRLNPTAVKLMEQFVPLPEFRQADPLDTNRKDVVVNPIDSNQYFGRVDHYFNDKNRVFGRIAIDRSKYVSRTLNDSFPFNNTSKVENLASQWIHTFNPSMFNELRFGFNRAGGESFYPQQNSDLDLTALGLDAFRVFNDGNRKFNPLELGLPSITCTGCSFASGGEHNQLDTYQFANHFSWIKGKHNIQAGGEYYYVTIERAAANVPNGSLAFSDTETGNSFASFMLGLPNTATTAEGWPFTYPRAGRQGYFVNDDWKVSSRLTLNLGLRFDYNGNSKDVQGLQRTLDLPLGTTFDNGRGKGYTTPDGTRIPIMFPSQTGSAGDVKLWKQDIRFFMPRVGIAWRPKDKWVIRTGAGWFDNINHMNTWTIFNLNPPKSGTSFLQSTTQAAGTVAVQGADGKSYNLTTRKYVPGTAIPTLSDPFSQLKRGAQNILMMPPDYKDGDVWKWSFDVQRELPWQVAMTVGYVGTKGSHVGNSIQNYNDARPSTDTNVQPRRPYQYFYDPTLPDFGIQNLGNVRYIDSYGESFYQALQVKVDKRYQNGLSGGIAYTYSKAYGDGENGGQEGASFQDSLDRLGSRGRFRFDQTHNFVAHYVWELPGRNMTGALKYIIGGWQSNGILSLRTGFPFTVSQGNDLNTGNAPIRPDRIQDGRIDNANRQLYFDPFAFQRVTCNNPQRPDLCHFGSAGYNILNTPGQRNLDFSLYKNFAFKERYSVQFRSEFFNAFNTPYFGQPNGIGFTTVNSVVPDASRMGEIRSIRTPMRIIQFGLKFFF